MRNRFAALMSLGLLTLSGCGGGDDPDPCCSALPDSGLYATFEVVGETFRASITDPDGMAEARALWKGESSASIPNGLLACTPVAWNEPWSWHLAPDSIRFADATIELCDGAPNYIEANCATFGERYCPWGAQLTELRDCDAGADCPPVPR